ncbi:histidine-type phosphatase [Carnimonas bestiolae]|uniref:histidine-type phosphatase n=1 Tax=Carnimonas bestiolae TaxID=3402172 RepID=UPI003F4A8678
MASATPYRSVSVLKQLCTVMIAGGFALLSLPAAADQTGTSNRADHYQLEQVVMLGRHGVRPQGNTAKLNRATGRQWPEFSVPDNHLTGHGYKGVADQAAYQLADWRARGLRLKDSAGCPLSDQLFIWSDVDQRTKATGLALADGMFPGCGLAPHFSAAQQDPLFSQASLGLSPLDTHKVRQRVLARMGGSPQAAARHYQHAVAQMRRVVCSDAKDACGFLDEPWGVAFSKSGKAKLTGPVSEGSSIAETIREQYSENMPIAQVAFGHGRDANTVRELMALHAAKYDLLSDTPEYARHGGSLLLEQMLAALSPDNADNAPRAHLDALNRPLVMLVGHDTNIAQVQTMLGFNWQLPGYPRNDIPPGGSLELQRYRNLADNSQWLRVVFRARSLDQWRRLSPLDARHPLPAAELNGEGCRATSVGRLCPLSAVVARARRQLVELPHPPTLFE